MRLDYTTHAQEATESLFDLSRIIHRGPLSAELRELLAVQVSQLNRCAHCIEVHWQKALKLGVSEQKLRLLSAFREAGVYGETELTALELGEAVTLLSQAGVSQELWDQVELAFPSEELRLHLLYQIILMNSWNRLSVALALAPPH